MTLQNPYQSPVAEDSSRRPTGPLQALSRPKTYLAVLLLPIAFVLVWLALCCLLGVYYGKGIVAPLTDTNAREHCVGNLPTMILLGVVGGFLNASRIMWRHLREAAEYRTQQLQSDLPRDNIS